jgi:hypothetical protein
VTLLPVISLSAIGALEQQVLHEALTVVRFLRENCYISLRKSDVDATTVVLKCVRYIRAPSNSWYPLYADNLL